MDRAQALAVLHEIHGIIGESISINSVSLTPSASDNYEIRLNCDFNDDCWKDIMPLLEKQGLDLRVKDGWVVISSIRKFFT